MLYLVGISCVMVGSVMDCSATPYQQQSKPLIINCWMQPTVLFLIQQHTMKLCISFGKIYGMLPLPPLPVTEDLHN